MDATFKNYYSVLEVDKKATSLDIKNAYRKMARKHHPDLHTKSEKATAEEKFKEINEAYAVLGDADKRAQYDRLTEDAKSGANRQPFPDNGGDQHSAQQDVDADRFSDFFESLFGRTGSGSPQGSVWQSGPERGPDLTSDLEITLEEAFHGGQKSLQLASRIRCVKCDGTGMVEHKICPACSGTTSGTIKKILDVRIPPFIRDGMKIRLRGQGGEGANGGGPGNLLLTVKILPHTNFSLKGDHLETALSIEPDQAVLGCRVSVPTMDGNALVTIPPMIHSGQKLRLKSKGWKAKGGNQGDLYVTVSIDIPHTLDQAQIELYTRIAGLRKEGEDK